MKLIDITQPLRDGMPVWPGDTKFSFELSQTKEESGSVNVGRISMSTHTGTHIDAPFHFDSDGEKVMDLDPSIFIGPARLIDLSEDESVGRSELSEHNLDGVDRLLIRTGSWTDRNEFPTSITYIRPDAAHFLAEKSICLVGVDVPSVDPLESKELPTHHALQENGIHILEGLVLDEVEPGDYELISLPLSIRIGDGSPVRAILRCL